MADDRFNDGKTQAKILDLLWDVDRPLTIAEMAMMLSVPVPSYAAGNLGELLAAGKVKATPQGKINVYEIV
jgi:hypothetical protein